MSKKNILWRIQAVCTILWTEFPSFSLPVLQLIYEITETQSFHILVIYCYRNDSATQLESRLAKIGATGENGSEKEASLTRMTKLVMAAASKTPNYKKLDLNSGMQSSSQKSSSSPLAASPGGSRSNGCHGNSSSPGIAGRSQDLPTATVAELTPSRKRKRTVPVSWDETQCWKVFLFSHCG